MAVSTLLRSVTRSVVVPRVLEGADSMSGCCVGELADGANDYGTIHVWRQGRFMTGLELREGATLGRLASSLRKVRHGGGQRI